MTVSAFARTQPALAGQLVRLRCRIIVHGNSGFSQKTEHVSDKAVVLPPAAKKLAANDLAFIKLAAIRIWPRTDESTP
jgi:hypothetical protein